MKQILRAELQNMAESELREMIPEDTMKRIKRKDKNPSFKAFVVGHEGEAHPTKVGGGNMAFRYLKDAVIKLGNKIRNGISVFIGHGETNSHEGRQIIGEVVGKGFKWVNNKLSAVAAIYVHPEYRDEPLDVASIESDVEYSLDGEGYAQVQAFNDITGIALGNSRVDQPAFSGATLLASLQAFQSEQGKFTHEKGGKMTLEEIKKAIQEGRFSPSQVFDASDLQADKVVVEHVKKEKQTEYEHAKRIEKQLGEEREEKMKLSKDYDDKLKEATRQLMSGKTETILKGIVTERKLDGKQEAFITRNLKSFNPEGKNEDEVKTEINKFIDGQIKEYEETAELFGIKKEEKKEKKDLVGDETAGGDNLEDPKSNPLIPQT